MHIASLVLGLVSLVFMTGGFFTTTVPILGSVLSFAAPLLSLAGIVTGGIAMSRSKQQGESSGAAIAGLVVNIIMFLLSLLVALTCGLCNACLTTAEMQNPNGSSLSQQFGEAMETAMAASHARVSMNTTMDDIGRICDTQGSTEQAEVHFHPGAGDQATRQRTLCAMFSGNVRRAFTQDCSHLGPNNTPVAPCSSVDVIDPSEHPQFVALGATDPATCFRFRSGTATITTCEIARQRKIVSYAFLNGVQ